MGIIHSDHHKRWDLSCEGAWQANLSHAQNMAHKWSVRGRIGQMIRHGCHDEGRTSESLYKLPTEPGMAAEITV
jgi:hypothetical protein